MKLYPSIPYYDNSVIGLNCIVFDKLDGSNLRWEWTRKKSWHKFGTRNRLFDENDPVFGCAIEIFFNDLAIGIEKALIKYGAEKAIVFTEFLGKHSFAGQHIPDDPKELVLFDINIHKKGILGPEEFVSHFGHLNIPEIVYRGIFTPEFINDIEEGNYPVNEGVIAKGSAGHKLWMAKIKTKAYKEKLKTVFSGTWMNYL